MRLGMNNPCLPRAHEILGRVKKALTEFQINLLEVILELSELLKGDGERGLLFVGRHFELDTAQSSWDS